MIIWIMGGIVACLLVLLQVTGVRHERERDDL